MILRTLSAVAPTLMAAALVLALTNHPAPVPVLLLGALLPMAMGAALALVRAR